MRKFWILAVLSGLVTGLAWAQPAAKPAAPAKSEPVVKDEVNQQAAKLESDLAKLKDSAPEAAPLMVELVNLYHKNARVFGLVTMAERFLNNQPQDKSARDVLLKLIDGLQATSRNKELASTARQFLTRFPADKDAGAVEITLAGVLEQLDDRPRLAEALAAVWVRQGDTPVGRQALGRAVVLFSALGSRDTIIRATQLCEQAIEKLPPAVADPFAWQGISEWKRLNEWAKSNQFAAKVLQKGLPVDPKRQRDVAIGMAGNYANLGQRKNAADLYKKARTLLDTPDVHYAHIMELHYAAVPTAEIEPVVNEYFQKYADRPDRFALRVLVGHACLRGNDKARATQIFAEVLPFDATAATLYLQQFPAEPAAGVAQAEQVLLAANAKTPAPMSAWYLKWVLGFELYRDRLKDLPKAKAMIRQLLATMPPNDGNSQQAQYWLLYNATSDAEFNSDLDLVLKSRLDFHPLTNHRSYLQGWITEALNNKDHKAHAEVAKAKLAEQLATPLVKDLTAAEANDKAGFDARARLLAAPANLNDLQANLVMGNQAYWQYQSGVDVQRLASVLSYQQYAARFPKDINAAYYWTLVAASYGTPDQCKLAVAHAVTQLPGGNIQNTQWYYLMMAADKTNEPAIVKQAFDWVIKTQAKTGPEPSYSYYIGDVLLKHKFVAEAIDYWKKGLLLNPDGYESNMCANRLATNLKDAERTAFLVSLQQRPCFHSGTYALWLADDYLKAKNLAAFEKTLRDAIALRNNYPMTGLSFEEYPPQTWVDTTRADKEMPLPTKVQILTVVRGLKIGRPSATATLALLEFAPPAELTQMQRLLAWQDATWQVADAVNDWDRLMPYAQNALAQKDYMAAASLLTGMLNNIPAVDPARKQSARDLITQSYTRIGGVGLTIDETSPIAPLLQAALYLRLGDERLAFDTYLANQKLFDEHRTEVPIDILLFVAESHLAAGGEVNLNRVEDMLTAWLVKFADVKEVDDLTKASVRLLLGKNYYKGQRYDVARGEYTTIINLYPNTKQSIEAEFGIGEAFMAQKVYDQAELMFEKLSANRDRDVVIRAEFLRGVLAHRRGDLDQARLIFRAVLDRVPSVELANQALFNLSEVYGAEQRYLDQLELLRTIGRLGRASKRFHAPGEALSIVVQDSDLGVSRGHSRIPVLVRTEPGGDEEMIYLYSGGAGKGLFRADMDTALGRVTKRDKVLQLTGTDVIKCDYPPEFKSEFKNVPLSDVEIRIASNGKFEASSGKIIDRDKETLSDRLEREARESQAADKRVSQGRPVNQVKPGNSVYLRVQDADRDLSDQKDKVSVKLTAASGDQIQVALTETDAHTGVFEASATTADLPAGALASDTAIEHSPLMAIDQKLDSFWLSEPDGATPKWLSVDMKDVREVTRVAFSTPDPSKRAPVRGELLGSNDGRYWFHMGAHPALPPAPAVAGEFGKMTQRVYAGNFTGLANWQDIVNFTKNLKPLEEAVVETLMWSKPDELEDMKKPYGVVWSGKLVQPRTGACRIQVNGTHTALWVDGRLELPPGANARTADVWLESGTHDVAIFAATLQGNQQVSALWSRSDQVRREVVMVPFRTSDFDLDLPSAKPANVRKPATVTVADGVWSFQFEPIDLRHVKFVVHEYVGEAVAINNVEVVGVDPEDVYIPTKADVLSLSNNNVLEIAAGDAIIAAYSDEFNQNSAGGNQLLTYELLATYYDASVMPIAYDFEKLPGGQVITTPKQLIRIDPGERVIVQVIDYDMDRTDKEDTIKIQVSVNDGQPIEMVAQETEPFSGIFTKEVDTAAVKALANAEGGKADDGKVKAKVETKADSETLTVKPGDRIYCTYVDAQNTFPGHAVPRESIVYVNQASEGRVRIVETRIVRPANTDVTAVPQVLYLANDTRKALSTFAFEVPLTVEVYDRDAARDAKSKVIVTLTTTDGAKIDVECVVSDQCSGMPQLPFGDNWPLEDGRFVGQVILQLGSKSSPDVVPLSTNMPRNLIGKGVLPEEKTKRAGGETLVTRVLNVSGKDRIKASYKDALRPKGGAKDLSAEGRLIANGTLLATDREYDKEVKSLHVGEKMFLMVNDADLDTSDERDRAKVVVSSDVGDKETIELEETLNHSGVFTGSITLKPNDKPKPGNFEVNNPAIETYFGDNVKLTYFDKAASTESGTLELKKELPVVIGTDGLVYAFSKTFNDEKLAVETKFHIAESFFELFKSHKNLGRAEEQKDDLKAGRRVLREVMEDYPSPKYVPRIAYLSGQFAQELKQWDDAIESYRMIVRQYPDHVLAPDAQYKLAQCFEEASRFDDALEAYVTLAATYPKSPLIANVMIRISDHFYKTKQYDVAAQVGEKFLEKFESHQYAPRMAFRIGQCYYKAEQFDKGGKAFDKFSKIFPDDELCGDALFWAGESYRMGKNSREAFRRYNKCRWEHAESEAAKYARGRLALPDMLAQFESEATSVEDTPNQ